MRTPSIQRRLVAMLGLALAVVAAASGPLVAQEVDVSALGPQVGDRLPDFATRDQNGAEHTLASVMGPNGTIFVLSRSADW